MREKSRNEKVWEETFLKSRPDTILAWLKRPTTQIDKFIQAERPTRYKCPGCNSNLINTRGHGLALIENTDYCQCLTCSREGPATEFRMTNEKCPRCGEPQHELPCDQSDK